MSLYQQFATDPKMERDGIILEYIGTNPDGTKYGARVTVARAGGANRQYAKVLEAESKPYRRAIQTETITAEIAQRLLKTTFVKAIIKNWETLVEDKWVRGIEAPEGGPLLPFNEDNVLATLEALPDLWEDIQLNANKVALYRQTILEEEAKN